MGGCTPFPARFVCLFVSSNLKYNQPDIDSDGVGPVRKLLMKNSKTMYLLAKAKATEKGPRRFRRFIGYGLTERELKRIFAMEGFNPKKKAMESYLEMWKEFELVKAMPLGEDNSNVILFILDPTEDSDMPLIKRLEVSFPDTTSTADAGVVVL